MARTADGDFGFADVCDVGPRDLVDFVEMDIESGDLLGLGLGTPWPYETAWADDGSIVYSTGDNLCTTLYRYADGDRPVDLEVDVDGRRFAAGQDLSVSPDGCPKDGRAGYPAFSADGRTLAFMASSDGDTLLGQALLDRPWTILVVRDGEPVPVLGGLGEPTGLIWMADGERLVFAARLHGRLGLWSIHPDGSGLTSISSMDAIHIAPDPAGNAVVAVLSSRVLSDGEYADDSEVVIVDLPPP